MKKIVSIIAIVLVAVMLTGLLGYVSKGYAEWNWDSISSTVTGWFSPAAPVVEESEFLYEFEDFEAYETDGATVYKLGVEDAAYEDCAEGDFVVVDIVFYLDGEEVEELYYEMPYYYMSDVNVEAFMFEGDDGCPGLGIYNNLVFDAEQGIEADFPFEDSEGDIVISVIFYDAVEDFDSFDIKSIEYVPAA